MLEVEFKGIDPTHTTLRNFKIEKEELLSLKISKIKDLILFCREKFEIKQKDETFFSTEGEIAPGVLCLVDTVDYNLCDLENTLLENVKSVVFICTMHGG